MPQKISDKLKEVVKDTENLARSCQDQYAQMAIEHICEGLTALAEHLEEQKK